MTIIDYLLIGAVAAAVAYTVYRLFLGWRNSTLRQDEERTSEQANASNFER
jgi:hypothetical protein